MDSQEAQSALESFAKAREMLTPWLEGAGALALLQGALATGIVQAARLPRTPADLAAEVRLEVGRVESICMALEAHGIFVQDAETYRLAEVWSALAITATIPLVRTSVDTSPAVSRALVGAIANDQSYWTMDSSDRVDLARWASQDPVSPLMPRILVAGLAAAPEVVTRLESGARCVEFGCGACGGLLSILQAYPKVTALGLDLDAAVLAMAAGRAEQLGVADRLELRRMDAGTLEEEAIADVLFWSQFFFPSATRAMALQAAFHVLKPGGILVAALLKEAPATPDELHAPAGRMYALSQVLFESWGVPMRSAAALQAEVSAAGFTPLRVGNDGFRYLTAERPANSR